MNNGLLKSILAMTVTAMLCGLLVAFTHASNNGTAQVRAKSVAVEKAAPGHSAAHDSAHTPAPEAR
jgi:hypothetical protein